MKVVVKHNGTILNEYGMDNIQIDKITKITPENFKIIKERLQFRPTEYSDFEYGIGGWIGDKHFKIKNIQLQNNDTEVIVRVSKVR